MRYARGLLGKATSAGPLLADFMPTPVISDHFVRLKLTEGSSCLWHEMANSIEAILLVALTFDRSSARR